MEAIWINAKDKTITKIEYGGLDDMRRLVDGSIEMAYHWPTGEVLYVDDEGLRKTTRGWFRISTRTDQPLSGNGLIVGREINDAGHTAPLLLTVDQVAAMVEFATDEHVAAWAKANASEPSMKVSFVNPDGTWSTEVLSTFGEDLGGLPKDRK
jgi:hypothetical protein